MIRRVYLAAIALAVLASAAHGGASWKQFANSSCTASDEPYGCCIGSGTGTCDDKWNLVLSFSDRNWLQACAQKALGARAPVCGTDLTIEDTAADADLSGRVCPTEANGSRFPVRRGIPCLSTDVPSRCTSEQQTAGASWFLDLHQAGDGTHDGATGTGSDFDYDKYPGGKYDDKPNFDVLPNRWETGGVWVPPWNGQCRRVLRIFFNDLLNRLGENGESKIDEQLQNVPDFAAE